MGFSFGAIALVILTALIIIIGREVGKEEGAQGGTCVLAAGRLLQQAGVGNDEQVLQRAAAWVGRTSRPRSKASSNSGWSKALSIRSTCLPSLNRSSRGVSIKEVRSKRWASRCSSRPEAIPMGTPVAMPTPVVMPTPSRSWFSGFAAWASSSSSSTQPTQPTLREMTEILKRELGLNGNMTDVVKQAAEQLNVDVRLPLVEMAKQCVQEAGGEGKVLKDMAAAAPFA